MNEYGLQQAAAPSTTSPGSNQRQLWAPFLSSAWIRNGPRVEQRPRPADPLIFSANYHAHRMCERRNTESIGTMTELSQ
jgi:hypothetical protein